MDIHLLIDSIVRQTTVLIAQLATSGGLRAPLAHIAGQVFIDLARELDNQGVSHKVSADMFGMALRTYQRKVSRLSESSTYRGRSLWEAVLDFIRENQVISRAQIMQRFHRDDEALMRGVLYDLCESGLVYVGGSGHTASYRSASEKELNYIRRFHKNESTDNLIWVFIYRDGPMSAEQIAERTKLKNDELNSAISRLLEAERIVEEHDKNGTVYSSRKFEVMLGSQVGWEAAVFDHYQSLVKTICCKLRLEPTSSIQDVIGGSTYTFVVWPGHPMEREIESELGSYRKRMSELRKRVDDYNEKQRIPERHKKVVSYHGQCVIEHDELE